MLKSLPAEDTTAELLREMLDVNLVGSFITAKAALERMGASLAIVNIASVSGLRANRGRLAYGAAKAGVKLMSEVLALEYGHRGVRVNCVAPGPIETPMVARCILPRNAAPGLPACRRPGTESPKKWPRRWPSCCRRRRATSTATRWWSMAVSSPAA